MPAQSAKVEKVFEGEDSRGAHLLTLHLHHEINLAIVLMTQNCLTGKSSNCLLYTNFPLFIMYHFGIYEQALLNSKDKIPNYIIIIELSMKFLSSSVRRGPGSSRQPAVQLKADPSQLGIQTCSLTHSLHNVQLSIQKHYY